MNVVGLVSCYKEGRLVSDAIESLQRVRLDDLLVYEGPAGDPLEAPVPESEFPAGIDVVENKWKTDANKRDAMLKAVQRMNLAPPVWCIWIDGDEILVNGEYLRDTLQAVTWDDEQRDDGNPWMRWPVRLIEADGAISITSNHIFRGDLVRSFDVAAVVVTDIAGKRQPGWGNVMEGSRAWLDHFLGAVDRGRMTAWPPLPCEPHIFHRSHLRHPLRRAARMHAQERDELVKHGLLT